MASRRQGNAAPFNARKWHYNMTLHELQWSPQMPPCLFLYFAYSTSSLLKSTTAAATVRESFVSGRQCCSRLVKTVTGKPVNRFPEYITSYRIYRTSRRHDPGNADAGALCCHECCHPPFSHNSSIVSSFWTSVLATVRLSTSAVYVCCPNTWTVLYFWMEISNWVDLVADFICQC